MPAPRSKYQAKRTQVDGIWFASKKEARRYGELKRLLMVGAIRNLKLQPRYGLCPLIIDGANVRDINAGTPSARRLPVANYVADFQYEERNGMIWLTVVEDTKGVKTDVYTLKKKWFEAQYGLAIRES